MNLLDRYEFGYQTPHKIWSTCHDFEQTWLKEKGIHYKIPGKPWEVIGADMFTLCNRNYLCIVDYHRKFPVIKKIKDASADNLILA